MTILEINNYFYRRGGSEVAMFESIAALEARAHRVVPFAMADPRNLPTPWAWIFPHPAPRWQFWKRFYNSQVSRALGKLIHEVQPDVAHLHNIAYHLTPSVIAVLKKAGIPMVQTLHDYQAVSPLPLLFANGRILETNQRGSWFKIILHRVLKGSLLVSLAAVGAAALDRLFGWTASISRFIAPSLCAANIATNYGLPSGHIVTALQSQMVHRACRRRPREATYFLYVGRLSSEKGVDKLIDWWANLPTDYRLLIVGTGPEEAALRARARGRGLTNIRWFGPCTNPQLLATLYEDAAAVLVPSQWYENAPYVVLEAFSHGTPVIASDIGGLPELVDESRGWLVDPESMLGWTAAIRYVAEHPVAATNRALIARRWLARTRQRSQYGQRLEAVLAHALACNRIPAWCTAGLA